jgi:hypothetical protein
MGEAVSLMTLSPARSLPYDDAAASEVAQRLDAEVLTLVRGDRSAV